MDVRFTFPGSPTQNKNRVVAIGWPLWRVSIEAYKIKEEKVDPSKRYYMGPLKGYLRSLRKQTAF